MSSTRFRPPILWTSSDPLPDFSSEDYDSQDDFFEDLRSKAESKSDAQLISVGLWSALEGKNIPLVFKSLVALAERPPFNRVGLQVYVKSAENLDHLYRYLPIEIRPKKEFLVGEGYAISVSVGDLIPETTALPRELYGIVNASNEQLILGGGVSDSIRRRARPSLQLEMNQLARKGICVGEAVTTGAHGVPGVHLIIHVPTASGSEASVLEGTTAALCEAEKKKVQRIAFPALGTGTGGLSIDRCAELMLKAISTFVEKKPSCPKQIFVQLWRKSDFDIFVNVFGALGQKWNK